MWCAGVPGSPATGCSAPCSSSFKDCSSSFEVSSSSLVDWYSSLTDSASSLIGTLLLAGRLDGAVGRVQVGPHGVQLALQLGDARRVVRGCTTPGHHGMHHGRAAAVAGVSTKQTSSSASPSLAKGCTSMSNGTAWPSRTSVPAGDLDRPAILRSLRQCGAQPGPQGAAGHRQQIRRGCGPPARAGNGRSAPANTGTHAASLHSTAAGACRSSTGLAAKLGQRRLPGRRLRRRCRLGRRRRGVRPARPSMAVAKLRSPGRRRPTCRYSRAGLWTSLNRPSASPTASALPSSRAPPSLSAKWNRLDGLGLRLRPQVDHQVAAGHEVQAGEGRVGQQVLHREHHRRPAYPDARGNRARPPW